MTVQILAIVVPVVCLIIFGLLSYSISQTMGRVHDRIGAVDMKIRDHIETCGDVDKKVLDAGMKDMRLEVYRLRDFVHWLGNCIMIIAAKFDVKLPQRPRLPEHAGVKD